MKECIAVLSALLLFFTSFLPFLATPLTPQKAYAEENCVYYVYDEQENIRFITDGNGVKVRSTEYDPFGNFRSALGTGTSYLYQAQQKDAESSFYYLRARYYDPTVGRFISKDPVKGVLENPQTLNPYVYVGNNPINRSDPSGEYWGTIINTGVNVARACASFIGKVGNKISNIVNKPQSQITVNYSENQLAHFQKIFEQGGIKSLLKSKESIGKNLIEHQQKLQQYKAEGGYTSSVEAEISNFQRELNAIDEILKMNK